MRITGLFIQRYDAFKFKPFMTNFQSRIKISG
ncbi:DUF3289 family protein [Escherichia albertii]